MMMKSCLLVAEVAGADATAVPDAQVMELRQYKIVPGKRDAFIAMFERLFVESQEQLGMRLIGQFRDGKDANRFVWLRSFPDMATREKALNAFYFGPVWNAHRAEANPMLDDNDNVLLLSPATAELAFGPAGSRAKPDTTTTPRGPLLATIEYLWKEPSEGFTTFFREQMKPAMEAAGLQVLAAYVPLDEPNNFPRLPVRGDRKLFVWFTRASNNSALATGLARLHRSSVWRGTVEPQLQQFEERPPQQLWLEPTPRSALL
jgi:hypothetical protein